MGISVIAGAPRKSGPRAAVHSPFTGKKGADTVLVTTGRRMDVLDRRGDTASLEHELDGRFARGHVSQ